MIAGQVALVTGGGRGIGPSIARELAAAGMRVAVAARTRPLVAVFEISRPRTRSSPRTSTRSACR